MLPLQSLTSRAPALNKGTIERCGKRKGSPGFGLAFDRGLIKGCETLSVKEVAEWGLMGDMNA